MEDVFPNLSQVPEEIRTHLEKMIDWLRQAIVGRNELDRFRGAEHILKVCDSSGNLVCLFKAFNAGDENLAKNEACVYLLDHPENDHRSVSPKIYGFSRVRPTVFLRFRLGNEMKMGILIEYAESKGCARRSGLGIPVNEVHKILITDIRFGNSDRNVENVLVQESENGAIQLVPVDHEMCFGNEVQPYNICSPCWLGWLKEEMNLNQVFSSESVSYVTGLDVEKDIEFVRRCGWEPGIEFSEKFKVFGTFLKKAVFQGLTGFHIGLIAAFKCENMNFNLQSIIDDVARDDDFYDNVGIRLEEALKQYQEEV
ncbi:unnamed protein product [Arabidopsis lyrata]|uniref:1-phosphatidylinositol 4-kinase n=1 Tax=Arabidopsis lyrata subsp. lyrata TaxID=81972 RepID=D7KBR3_ARALL|nr:phosphatidylinositol 4-kinase gamma 4 [Arabidopsis lyrata subsp. lyrata]XP_020869069.1 phosphatidylinositol 4-kinase gamma 4 [Arabidopsis lyrata subsp. lyrata]EFH66991.1 hypothetical protein ARALYDRAFT_890279 [Arabidopsis lyrata subsp. lyrata]CAH8253683.1 unnamed protein product [Arabidopsis lyrata]|eukprot:XP_002890732.1 phosphatidylinositol 4-kinase gamma 4 [Arabidopsis lyrata subsp. lyrata]